MGSSWAHGLRRLRKGRVIVAFGTGIVTVNAITTDRYSRFHVVGEAIQGCLDKKI